MSDEPTFESQLKIQRAKNQRPQPKYDCDRCEDTGLIAQDLTPKLSAYSPWDTWLPCFACDAGLAMAEEHAKHVIDPTFGSEAWIQNRGSQEADPKSEAGRANIEAAEARRLAAIEAAEARRVRKEFLDSLKKER